MRTMRVGGLLVLLVAFAVGIGSAFVVAYFTLDAKPVVAVDKGPTINILVAKEPIALGEEITAEAVVFQSVPVAELPEGAISNFFQAYRRRPAYPIPPGCPICEDLLIQKTTDAEQLVRYIPVGSQNVVLEIEQVRWDREGNDGLLPITQILSPEDCIDIRVVDRPSSQGELVERKNNILRTYALDKTEQKEEIGELVLENVPIHDVRSNSHTVDGRQYQTVSLLLETDQVEKLYQAARDGRLRIALSSVKSASEPVEEPAEETLQAVSEPEQQTEVEPEQQAKVESAQQAEAETEQQAEMEPAQQAEAETEQQTVEATAPTPTTNVVRLIAAPIEDKPFMAIEEEREEQQISATPISMNLTFTTPQTSTSVRNEPMVVEKAVPKSAVVGLAYSSEERPAHTYSPFNIKSRPVESKTAEPTVPQPLPPRQRFQWN